VIKESYNSIINKLIYKEACLKKTKKITIFNEQYYIIINKNICKVTYLNKLIKIY
jgi:hypothetical protein